MLKKCEVCGRVLPDGFIYNRCIACKGKTKTVSVTKPEHYHKGGIDVIGFCKDKLNSERQAGFFQMNILKYVTRYTEKNGVEDLKKAENYLKMLIELEESK